MKTLKDIEKCYYCNLINEKIEASGMWYCPNPRCTGPGAAWFRRTLKSYEESQGGTHTVDEKEWNKKSKQYIKENKINLIFENKINGMEKTN